MDRMSLGVDAVQLLPIPASPKISQIGNLSICAKLDKEFSANFKKCMYQHR